MSSWSFCLKVLLVGLHCVIVVFTDHTHFLKDFILCHLHSIMHLFYNILYNDCHHRSAVNYQMRAYIWLLHSFQIYPGIQYRLPCTPSTIFHGCQIVHWYHQNVKGRFLKKLTWALWKCMVSMATHSRFENGGMPTKVLKSQLLLIFDY